MRRVRRIGKDSRAVVIVRHDVVAQRLTARDHGGHRLHAFGIQLAELLHPPKYLVELADQCLSLLRLHAEPRKLGDVPDRAEVDRHAAPIPIIHLMVPDARTARTLAPRPDSDKAKSRPAKSPDYSLNSEVHASRRPQKP